VTTLTYTGKLVVVICWCGIRHAIPSELDNAQRRTGETAYCPLGHGYVPTAKSELAELKANLKYERDRLVSERARADGAEASLRTTKGHVTRLRKRVIEGECPLCGQHLRDLARHVARVHPGETPDLEA
jgi:DNA repair exonuclease SbcCD ATPase subunit